MMKFKRRINIFYLKCIFIMFLVIFYFSFLFRESINAFHTINLNKEKHNLNKENIKFKIFTKKGKLLNSTSSLSHSSKITTETATTKYLTTLNPIYEYSEELHSAIEKELLARKLHMQKVCIKENITKIYPPNAWEFFLSQGHNLIWCNVFKAASSTWMYYFNILGGYDIKYLQRTKAAPLELARKKFPRPKLNELQDAISSTNSVSFLIVREPFERLLSAYRDKIENCHNQYYKMLAKQILKTFRKKSSSSSLSSSQQQQQDKGNKSQQKSSYINRHHPHHHQGPSFKEFLLYLIKNYKENHKFDEHWTPIYSFCTPCSINFTLIVKIETFQRDSEFIIRQAGIEHLLLGKLTKHQMKKISNQSTRSSRSLINRYFSQIDRDILDEIIEIYRLDFELFGYNLTKYYDIVQPPPPKIIDKNLNIGSSSTLYGITNNNSDFLK